MKPPTAKGSRGFRVLSASVDRRHALLEARPGPLPLSVDEALDAIGADDFPPLLVMELVTGPEHTVDGICRDGRLVLGHAKTREAMRAGLAMWFETVDRPDFVDAADRLARELGLDWLVNVQFIGDRLLEINPRISTIVYQEDLNLPYLAIRHALGEISRRRARLARPACEVDAARASLLRPGRVGRTAVAVSTPPPPSTAGRLLSLGRQSLIYGLGPVVSRFASLLLLPLYTHYLTPADYGQVETLTALVAVAVTIAQLGMVNALFRFALERQGRGASRGDPHRARHVRRVRPRRLDDRGAR